MSFMIDCYQNFGWIIDNTLPAPQLGNTVKLTLKRDRRIINKAELTRLQRQFEACLNELSQLQQSKSQSATALALTIGFLGTAFMAGSVFAITAASPKVWLCILLAIPGILGWLAPYFVYQKLKMKKTTEVTPLLEKKYDEIYEICERGAALIHR